MKEPYLRIFSTFALSVPFVLACGSGNRLDTGIPTQTARRVYAKATLLREVFQSSNCANSEEPVPSLVSAVGGI